MKIVLAIASMLIGLFCFACLNEHHVNKFGKKTIDEFTLSKVNFYKQQDIAGTEKYLAELLQKETHSEKEILETQNSIAVCYIKLNRLDEAEKILSALLKRHPKDYSVVVNLGTLFELQGKNEKALEYIKKAVAINPGSHGGSEWLHIKVLEFKVKNVPQENIPGEDILKLKSLKTNPYHVAAEIEYQLQERIPFTQAPNLMMAKMLQEYGDFLADSISLSGAYVMYEIAMDYDRENILKLTKSRDALIPYLKKYGEKPPQTGVYYIDRILPVDNEGKVKAAVTILEKSFDYFSDREKKRKGEAQQKQYFIFGSIGLAVLIAGIFFYKKRKQAE
jgi:tetratricopeptide (TPR) repeat protein